MSEDNRNYVVKFEGKNTYYSKHVRWKGTTIDKATWLTHKDATIIRNKLNHPRIKMHATIEPRN